MRLRRSVRNKEGSVTQRVAVQLDATELKHLTGHEPGDHPRICVSVEHGLMRVRAPGPSDDIKNSFSMWRVKQRATPVWEAQLNVRVFEGVRLSEYDNVTEVITRKAGNGQLHAQLETLHEGETNSAPPARANTGRPRKNALSPEAPKPSKAVSAPSKPEQLDVGRLLPKEFVERVQVEPVADTTGIAAEINSRYALSETDRSLLRAATALINDQVRRGGVRPVIQENGEVSLQVIKIRVDTESL